MHHFAKSSGLFFAFIPSNLHGFFIVLSQQCKLDLVKNTRRRVETEEVENKMGSFENNRMFESSIMCFLKFEILD